MSKRVLAAVGAVLVVASGAAAQEPLSLQQAVQRATEATAAARVADLEVRGATARVAEARSALLPQLSASAMTMQHTFNMDAFGFSLPTPLGEEVNPLVGPVDQTDARVRLNQTLFDPAGYLRLRASRTAVTGTSAQAEVAREAVAHGAAAAYLRALRARSLVEARQADAKLAAELLELAEAQLEAGVSTAIDVTRARTQKVSAEGALLVARSAVEQSQIALARSLGADPSTRYALTDPLEGDALVRGLPTSADSLVALAVASRAEVKAVDAAGAVARGARRAIRAERLPRVDLFADYGASGLHPSDAIATRQVGVQVSIPLVDGFRRAARLEEQAAVLEETDVRAADVRAQVKADVSAALLELENGRQQREIATERLHLGEEELAQAKERFANGVAGNIELINAQASLNQARDAAIDASFAIATAEADLARAVGVTADGR